MYIYIHIYLSKFRSYENILSGDSLTYGGGCGVQCAGYGLGTGTLCGGVVWVRWVHWCGVRAQLKCTLGTLFGNNVFVFSRTSYFIEIACLNLIIYILHHTTNQSWLNWATLHHTFLRRF